VAPEPVALELAELELVTPAQVALEPAALELEPVEPARVEQQLRLEQVNKRSFIRRTFVLGCLSSQPEYILPR
jgi:hypothetical protein